LFFDGRRNGTLVLLVALAVFDVSSGVPFGGLFGGRIVIARLFGLLLRLVLLRLLFAGEDDAAAIDELVFPLEGERRGRADGAVVTGIPDGDLVLTRLVAVGAGHPEAEPRAALDLAAAGVHEAHIHAFDEGLLVLEG